MYERHNEPLLSVDRFIRRRLIHGLVALVITIVVLGIGVLVYDLTEGFSLLNSLLNASMILGGMGPVDTLRNDAGKLFASCYALFSGMVFLGIAGILLAPAAHRVLHWMHLGTPGVTESMDDTVCRGQRETHSSHDIIFRPERCQSG